MAQRRRITPDQLRSRLWFDNPDNPGMTALYLERYLNYGLTPQELQSGKPIIGIAQTGSDLSPCNRHHIELAKRVRDGITAAGGVALEFPCHPIQETGKRPTACLDRNLSYLSLVEVLYGYPLDGVVLLTGCDKTTPACLMAAATVNIPAISLNVGPMLNGWSRGDRTGSGTIVWKARERHAAGDIDYQQFIDIVASSAPSVGHCNTMGTASTMNALAEALGMSLPGSAAIPAPYRERGQVAYETGKPSDIMTREAFENVIVANSAIGGSTNAPIHVNAIAKHIGVELTCDDWERIGFDVPLLVNMRPAGRDRRTDRRGPHPRERHDRERPHHRGELPGEDHLGPRRDPAPARAAEGEGGFSQPQGQPVRLGDHEDERHQPGVPRALPQQPRR